MCPNGVYLYKRYTRFGHIPKNAIEQQINAIKHILISKNTVNSETKKTTKNNQIHRNIKK